ncbi:carbamoyltransferase HypF, partial [Aegicerativicinus sediminis]
SFEIQNAEDRRYQYAFTTCVNCGPRWSVTKKFPFEREHTSIAEFVMCKTCLTEYKDPSDRRFHSQTNTCGDCGISLQLLDSNEKNLNKSQQHIFESIGQYLKEGKIVAVKNTSGYLLCCNAENENAVAKLRKLKKRPTKPFALLFPNLKHLKGEFSLSPNQEEFLKSKERPIVIIPVENYFGRIALNQIAPGLKQLGVMVPYTGILELLGESITFPIVATSGNIHGSPILSDSNDALEKLGSVADYFLQHDLHIEHPQDDSVIKLSFQNEIPILFRRSRGYAPNFFTNVKVAETKILAMGADLKNSFAFMPNEYVYVSQYLGNLENFDVYQRFITEIKSFTTIFNQIPETIVIDKHPRYFSCQLGKELAITYNSKLIEVQHHKAHFASVLGEHNLFQEKEKILGVVWDGVGFGDDGEVWGGEFFDFQNGFINRINHFEYFEWLAGDKMSKEPRLSLFSLLKNDEIIKHKFSNEEFSVYRKLKKINKLKTSSVGRLFDAVASLLNICDYNSFEGEAAILLENNVSNLKMPEPRTYYKIEPTEPIQIGLILDEITKDFERGIEVSVILFNFIFTLATIIVDFAKQNDYTIVCCSGGVFQNTTLIDILIDIKPDDLQLCFNKHLPPNDENISFGQLMYVVNCKL